MNVIKHTQPTCMKKALDSLKTKDWEKNLFLTSPTLKILLILGNLFKIIQS